MKSFIQKTILFLGIWLLQTIVNSQIGLSLYSLINVDPALHATTHLSIVPFTLITAALLILISKNNRLERGFYAVFAFNTLFFAGVAAALHYDPTLIQEPYFFRAFTLWNILFSQLGTIAVWGYANQQCSFKMAAFAYPFLIILSFATSIRLPEQLYMLSSATELHIAALSLLAMLIFAIMRKCEPSNFEPGAPFSWRYAVSIYALAFGFFMAMDLPKLLFRIHFGADFLRGGQYWLALFDHPTLISYSLIATLLFVAIAGLYLCIKGMKRLALALFVFLAAAILLQARFIHTSSAMVAAFYTYSTSCLLIPCFMYFKELTFFFVERSKRFRVKIITDLLISSITPAVASIMFASVAKYADSALCFKVAVDVLFGFAWLIALGGLWQISKAIKNYYRL